MISSENYSRRVPHIVNRMQLIMTKLGKQSNQESPSAGINGPTTSDPTYLNEWYHTVMTKVNTEIDFLKTTHTQTHVKKVLNCKETREKLEKLQVKYVFVPTDKAISQSSVNNFTFTP